MPYGWLDPDVFLEHGGVTVYHVYKDDDVSAGRRECWYTTDWCGGDCDDPCAFDVRDLSTFEAEKPYAQVIREAIDKGELKQEKSRENCIEEPTSEKQFVHVILYNDPQECYVGMDIFDTFELALAQFRARLQAVIDEYENGTNCIDILIEDTEQRELRFRADDGYEVLYLCEGIQHTLGKE